MLKDIMEQANLFSNEITVFLNTETEQLKLGTIETVDGDFKAVRSRDKAIFVTREKYRALSFIMQHKAVHNLKQINLF